MAGISQDLIDTLTEVSKIECQLKVNKPEEPDTSTYEVNNTAGE